METQKSKVVNMNKVNTSDANKTEPRQKLTYEQLNDACNQLFQQNQKLYKKIQELEVSNMFARLDYLFKVIELSSTFKDTDFVNDCIEEIKEALTIKKDSKEG